MLVWFHQPAELIGYTRQYFRVEAWMSLPLLLLIATQQIFYAALRQRVVIITDCISLVIFAALAYAFIFGLGFIPACGIRGLAYAFVIQVTLGFFMLLGCLYWQIHFKPYLLFHKHSTKGWVHLRQMFKVGWPMSFQFSAEMIAFAAISIMVGWIGVSALASTQIVNQFIILVIVPIFAVSEAVGILVSHEAGAKQYQHMRQVGNIAIFVVMAMVLLGASVFLLAPHWLASFYFNVNNPANAHLLQVTTVLFMVLSCTLFLDSFRNLATGALRGLFDTRYPMWVGIFAMWGIMLPLAYLFGFPMHGGVVGIYLSGLAALGIGALLVWRRWHRLSRHP